MTISLKKRLAGPALVDAVERAIRAEPHRWDQSYWVSGQELCTTTLCYAGWAAVLSGEFELVIEPLADAGDGSPVKHFPYTRVGFAHTDLHRGDSGETVSEAGSRLFGVSKYSAEEVFHQTDVDESGMDEFLAFARRMLTGRS